MTILNDTLQAELRDRYNPEGSNLRKIQLKLLEGLLFIDEICKKNNITYWIGSGTCLGAVRHSGFIPWDDDLDIEMLVVDYLKFEKIIQQECLNDDRFEFQNHSCDSDYLYRYGKLRYIRGKIVEFDQANNRTSFNGISIDIFPMQESSSLCMSKIARRLAFGLFRRIAKYNSQIAYSGIVNSCNLIYAIEKIFPKKCLRHRYPSYFLKRRDYSDIFPLRKIEFENIMFPAPKDCHSYLLKIYGSYEKLPDIANREVHYRDVVWD